MVEITIWEDGRGRPSSFFASGHAGWDRAGDDVVCAAVSVLLQSAWLGLTDVARVEVVAEKSEGRLRLAWPAAARDDAASSAIVETTARSLEQIARQYPRHVRAIRARADE